MPPPARVRLPLQVGSSAFGLLPVAVVASIVACRRADEPHALPPAPPDASSVPVTASIDAGPMDAATDARPDASVATTLVEGSGGTTTFHPEFGDATSRVAALPGAIRGARILVAGSAVSTYAGCFVDEQKRVACWTGPNILHFMSLWGRAAPPGPSLVGIADAKRIAMGGPSDLCAVLEDGSLTCKGSGDPARAAVVMGGIDDVAFGSGHGCALGRDGKVRCWGASVNDSLGIDAAGTKGGPIRRVAVNNAVIVAGVADAVALAAGGYGTCAVTKDGALYCWGASPFASAPDFGVRRFADAHVRRIAIGHSLGCLTRDDDDHLRCALRGNVVRIEPALPSVVDLATDGATACAVLADGAVWCWGPGPSRDMITGAEGQARDRAYEHAAWRVAGIDDAVQVSLAGSHGCVRTRAGSIRCWGPNTNGELGDGTLVARSSPSWVVDHKPDLLPEPTGGPFGCRATVDQRRACYQTSHECRLAASPDYWMSPNRSGVRCDEQCREREMAAMRAKPVPSCLCTCSAEYKAIKARQDSANRRPPPP